VGAIIDGKAVAAAVRSEVRERVAGLRERGVRPGLATVLVGHDPASQVYVRNKQAACADVGIESFGHTPPAESSAESLRDLIASLAADDRVHGILLQLPLPGAPDPTDLLLAIPPVKDVDGLHPINQGRLLAGLPGLRPCTPLGVMRLLQEVGVDLRGRHAVVVGRSALVGKPVALLLLEQHATVTMCHSRTRDLAGEIRRADVVVAAVGQAGLIRGEWLRPEAIVIDVGMNRGPDGKLCGDVEFAAALDRCALITPVPGGVGPMTVAMLLANTADAAAQQAGAAPR
jgi:methylenetetrahydrofolate dehydrogenase (NADP+)/methenyltetrahydrofolate cyclohydrolase